MREAFPAKIDAPLERILKQESRTKFDAPLQCLFVREASPANLIRFYGYIFVGEASTTKLYAPLQYFALSTASSIMLAVLVLAVL